MTEHPDLPVYTEVAQRDVTKSVDICMKLVWQQVAVVHELVSPVNDTDWNRISEDLAKVRNQIDTAIDLLRVLRGFLD